MTPYRRYNHLSEKPGQSSADTPSSSKKKNRLGVFELQCIICAVVIAAVLLVKALGGQDYIKVKLLFSSLFTGSAQSAQSVPQTSLPSGAETSQPAVSASTQTTEPAVTSQVAVTEQEIEDTVAYIRSLLPSGTQIDDATIQQYARQYLENKAAESADSAAVSSESLSPSAMSVRKYPQPDSSTDINTILQQMSILSAQNSETPSLTQQLETVTQDGDLVPTALLTDTDLKKTSTFAQKAEGGLLAAPEGTSFAPFFADVALQNPLKTDFRISSKFGYRYHPVTGMFGFHTGVDLPADSGTYIYAAAAGKIIDSGYSDVWGNFLVIKHSDETETFYAHCKTLLRKKGASVKKGQAIARVGTTGMSTGPHLHYEVHINGIYMDPSWVLDM